MKCSRRNYWSLVSPSPSSLSLHQNPPARSGRINGIALNMAMRVDGYSILDWACTKSICFVSHHNTISTSRYPTEFSCSVCRIQFSYQPPLCGCPCLELCEPVNANASIINVSQICTWVPTGGQRRCDKAVGLAFLKKTMPAQGP